MARSPQSPGRKTRDRIVKSSASNSIPSAGTRAIQSVKKLRRVCFITGTRAEFGLMQSTLAAIRAHPHLKLQIIATGMHLSARHGRTVQGVDADAIVPWAHTSSQVHNALATGKAISSIARELQRLKSEIVLVVGDRVEAFAAATAGHLAGKIVAHVHGGDRALGQVDDSLRHAITKLSHLHFPATPQSKKRILKLGEDPWRVHLVGSPGIDGIVSDAVESKIDPRSFALLVLHPTDVDHNTEQQRARLVLQCVRQAGFERIVVVYPNNDPGSTGIIREWKQQAAQIVAYKNVARPAFLGLMRDAAVLVGNSSSGIIEAASFGTPVIDVGPRQRGRECSSNCVHVPFSRRELGHALRQIWRDGNPIRFPARNVYGANGTGHRIAQILAETTLSPELQRKLIAY